MTETWIARVFDPASKMAEPLIGFPAAKMEAGPGGSLLFRFKSVEEAVLSTQSEHPLTGDDDLYLLSTIGESDELLRRAAFELRAEVFLREVGRDREVETDDEDATAVHLIVRHKGKVIGTLRMYRFDPEIKDVKIGRVAIASSFRRRGIGRLLMVFAHHIAVELGCATCYLHAEIGASGFYDKIGYKREGDQFEEAGLLHQRMYIPL